jgi:hypothetical protein
VHDPSVVQRREAAREGEQQDVRVGETSRQRARGDVLRSPGSPEDEREQVREEDVGEQIHGDP